MSAATAPVDAPSPRRTVLLSAPGTADPALLSRAEAGDLKARLALAFFHDERGETDFACHWMDEAARTGAPSARAQRAAWRLFGVNYRRDEAAGFAEIEAAAYGDGDVSAIRLIALLRAFGLACARDWPRAVADIARVAAAGQARAGAEIAALGREALAAGSGQAARANADPLPLAALAAAAAAADPALWRPREHAILLIRPRIDLFRDAAPAEWRGFVMRVAGPRLHAAHVRDRATGRRSLHPMRTNRTARIEIWDGDLVHYALAARIAAASGDPIERQEPPAILCYRPGEAYRRHFDFIDPDVPAFRRELAEQGQRIKTPLIYLNDAYEGGETSFPEADFAFRGRGGDLLIFRNTRPGGRPDRKSLHAGEPPISGEKWVLSTRIRTRSQLGRLWRDIGGGPD